MNQKGAYIDDWEVHHKQSTVVIIVTHSLGKVILGINTIQCSMKRCPSQTISRHHRRRSGNT